MKRKKLIKYLRSHNCALHREGAKHTMFINLNNNKKSTVPRHTEIKDLLAKKICKDLDIPSIK